MKEEKNKPKIAHKTHSIELKLKWTHSKESNWNIEKYNKRNKVEKEEEERAVKLNAAIHNLTRQMYAVRDACDVHRIPYTAVHSNRCILRKHSVKLPAAATAQSK